MLRQQPESLRKDHPFFCLKYVSRNQAIPQNLRALRASEHYEALKQALIDAVKSDYWDRQPILSHGFMQKRFPDHEVAPLIENLLLLVRQEGGHLSEAECQAVSTWLNLKEQFGGEKASLYRTAYPVRQENMEAIKNSQVAQAKVQELVKAVQSGNWKDSIFDSPYVTLRYKERIPLKDLVLYAKRENLISAAAFRLAFAWADIKKGCHQPGNASATPVLYPGIGKERLKEMAKLRRDPRIKNVARQLREAIKSGNWESDLFKRTYLRERFPDLAASISMKEIALAEHAAGKLNEAACQVVMLWLNLREQYGSRVATPDKKASGPKETVWHHLPSVTGMVKVHRLFDDNNELTDKGREYLNAVADRLERATYFGGYALDKEAIIERLGKLPRNLQIIFEVDGVDGREVTRNRHLKYWFEQFYNYEQNPLSTGKYSFVMPKRNWSEIEALHVPPAGLLREFNLQFWASKQRANLPALPPEMKAMESIRVFGRVSSATRDELTMECLHPVLCYHPDVADNYLDPHGNKAGAAFAPLHDDAFHTVVATAVSPSARRVLTKVLPNFIRGLVASAKEQEKAAARELIEALGDLNNPQDLRDKDGVEKMVARLCVNRLRNVLHQRHFRDENGLRYESAIQVGYSRFYLNLLKALPKHRFPEPYGKSPASKFNYQPVLSGEWRHLKQKVIHELKSHVIGMCAAGCKATPEGKEFIRDLFAHAPPSAVEVNDVRQMMEQLEIANDGS